MSSYTHPSHVKFMQNFRNFMSNVSAVTIRESADEEVVNALVSAIKEAQ